MATFHKYVFDFDAKVSGFIGASNKIESSLSSMDSKAAKIKGRFRNISKSAGSLFSGSVSSAASNVFKGVLRVTRDVALSFITINREAELMRAKLTTITGSAEAGGRAFDMMLTKASEMPFTIDAIVDSFAKIKAAGIDDAVQYVDALTNAISAFGGSSEDLKFSTMAVQQMVGKGIISMEEMRRQLAERIPTALGLMADAMDMTIGQLSKTISDGLAPTSDFLGPMMKKFQEVYGGANQRMMNTFAGSIIKVKTAWSRFMISIGDGNGSFKGIKSVVDSVASSLNKFRESSKGMDLIDRISSSISNIAKGFANPDAIESFFGTIVKGAADVIAMFEPFKNTLSTLLQLSDVGLGMNRNIASLGVGFDAFKIDSSNYLNVRSRVVELKRLTEETHFWNIFVDHSAVLSDMNRLTKEIKSGINGEKLPILELDVEARTRKAQQKIDSLALKTQELARGKVKEALSVYTSNIRKAMDDTAKSLTKAQDKVESLENSFDKLKTSLENQEFKLELNLLSDEGKNQKIRSKIEDLKRLAGSVNLSSEGGYDKQLEYLNRAKSLIGELSDTSRKVTADDVSKAKQQYISMQNAVARHNVSSKRDALQKAYSNYVSMQSKFKSGETLGDEKGVDKEKLNTFREIKKLILENRQAQLDSAKERRDGLDKAFKAYTDLAVHVKEEFESFDKSMNATMDSWSVRLNKILGLYQAIGSEARGDVSKSFIPSGGTTKAFASGGSVVGNESILVGEKGPEIFTPKQNGYIIPNNEIGKKSKTVNINLAFGNKIIPLQGPQQSADMLIRELKRKQMVAA
jgi:tape measure domain-containing protein